MSAIGEPSPDFLDNLKSSLLITCFAFIGGAGAHFFTQGLNPIPENGAFINKFKLKPFVTGFIFPTLLAQIIWGILAYNGLPEVMKGNYNFEWGGWIRAVGGMVILIRTGLELDLSKSATYSFAVFPALLEAILSAILQRYFFNIPWLFAFSSGFLISAIGPSTLVPSILKLKEENYGAKKEIPVFLLSSCGLSIVFALAGFTVFKIIAFSELLGKERTLFEIFFSIVSQLFSGIGLAGLLLLATLPFKNSHKYVKLSVILTLATMSLILFRLANQNISSIITTIFYAFFLKQKIEGIPKLEIKYMWFALMPAFHGHFGAQFDLSRIDPSTIGKTLGVLIAGVTLRSLIALILLLRDAQYNWKERLFLVIAWMPKASLQATFGGLILDQLLTENYHDLSFGTSIFVLNILGVLVTVPISSILTDSLGPKLLSKDTPESVQNNQPVIEKKISDVSKKKVSELPSPYSRFVDEDDKATK
jgi:solute carrier family 9B (sodium/hydrogen exchanger), member 1/2